MPSILIVDDSPGVHETLRTLLRAQGFDTVFFRSAEDAFERYTREQFDVVLTDIWMKPMNGVTLLKKILREDPFAVVVMMTGFDSKEFVIRSFKNGAFDYLEKPFRFETLTQTLKAAIEERKKRLECKASGNPGIFIQTTAEDDGTQLEDERREIEGTRETLQRLEKQIKKRELQLKESEQALFRRSDELAAQRRNLDAEKENIDEEIKQRLQKYDSLNEELLEKERYLEKAMNTLGERENELARREVKLQESRAELEAAQEIDTDAVLKESGNGALSPDTAKMLKDLEMRAQRLAEAEEAVQEREQFVEESENTLFDKGQSLQELETNLEQMQDDLNSRAKAIEALEKKLTEAARDGAEAPLVEALKLELEEKTARIAALERELTKENA